MNATKRRAIFERLRAANPSPTTELAYSSSFELLIAVILSAQATDVSVNKATRTLFPAAHTPEAMLALGEEGVRVHIRNIGLFNAKAKNVIATRRLLVERYAGEVQSDREALESLPGVGRKTANVVLNTAFGVPVIAVDTHIFRVANRTRLAQHRSRGGQTEHARRRPSGKRQHALDRAGREQQCRRLHRVCATVTDRVQPKAAFAAHHRPDAPAECHPDPGAAQLAPQGIAGAPVRVRVSGAVPRRQERVGQLAVDLAAGGRRFVDEQHRTPGRVRGDRGADTRRPCPEHGHVHGAERHRGSGHAAPPGSTDSTRMPFSTGVRHAWRSTPSIRTRHS